ncbi:MAG: hypothetical protein MR935_04420 [Agathobaculum sp.]|nr:hypothetical protein [Agathobaculum sp.]
MKNIDFTDFFNVFLSGATIWVLLFLPGAAYIVVKGGALCGGENTEKRVDGGRCCC